MRELIKKISTVFSLQKKKLTIKEIDKLYRILLPYLPKEEEEYLILQVDKILESITPRAFTDAVLLMFKKIPKKSDIAIGIMFIRGLKENEFFEYANIVKGFERGKRRNQD